MSSADDPSDLMAEAAETVEAPKKRSRDAQLANLQSVRDQALAHYKTVTKGYEDQEDRFSDTCDYWDIYNCKLGSKQFYAGTSKVFVPIVHAAIEARKTRFANQLFPQSERYVECTAVDGKIPHEQIAILENYVKLTKLKTEVIPALLRNGDVEGQYTVAVGWETIERHVTRLVTRKAVIDAKTGEEDPDEEFEDVEEEEIDDGRPVVEVIADQDVCVVPATADSIQEAIQNGGSVTIARRWTKAKIKTLLADGKLNKEAAETLLTRMEEMSDEKRDKAAKAVMAAGVRKDSRGEYALVYETWGRLKVDKSMRLCQMLFGGDDIVLSVKRNPHWSDRVPVFSVPVKKIQGSFKGQSLVKPVADLQYIANDATNEAMDNLHYALSPIVLTDPEKNPRLGSMVLAQAAIWQTSPNDTQFAKFPEVYQDALQVVATCESKVMNLLSVNSSMMNAGSPYRKPTQAEVAQDQQVDILTTADAVGIVEEGILTPLIQFFAEMDLQYRESDIVVAQYGQMGVQAEMRRIAPIQIDRGYQFRWYGVEAGRTVQQVQQQIAMINVVRGVPPQLYPGYELDIRPAMVQLLENAFGPRLAPLMFKDMRSQLSLNPELENGLLIEGVEMPVHPLDDHAAHMRAHVKAIQETGDPRGTLRVHLLQHQKQMAEMAAARAQQMGSMPGGPGAGPPQMGAQPDMIRNVQNPPGAVPVDNMQDPGVMPRRIAQGVPQI